MGGTPIGPLSGRAGTRGDTHRTETIACCGDSAELRAQRPSSQPFPGLDAALVRSSLLARRNPMNAAARSPIVALVSLAVLACTARATVDHAQGVVAPIYGVSLPDGYRDWRLVSVAHEEGSLNDIRAILANDVAIDAYRRGLPALPDGSIIARLAWDYRHSEENDSAFARAMQVAHLERPQSFVAGPAKNGVQFMLKDSRRYAASGGWGYAHFNDGKPADEMLHATCHACHEAARERDFVFTRYAP
jgi:hypothetical protein